MKKLFLLLLVLPITLFSQELWPTSNAEWTYSTTDNQFHTGYSNYKIERDTLIQGNVCQIYSKHSKTYFSGIPGGSVQELNKNIHFIIRLTDVYLVTIIRQTINLTPFLILPQMPAVHG